MTDLEDLTLTVGVDVQGLGDAEMHCISLDAADAIHDLVVEDLAERHPHLEDATDVNILAITAPNEVAIHYDHAASDSADEPDADGAASDD